MLKIENYFDANAFYPINQQVLEILKKADYLYNPSSIHSFGRSAKEKIENTRDSIKHALNAEDYQIIFCSNGSEANSLAMQNFRDYAHVISSTEHLTIINNAINPIYIKVNKDGLIDIHNLEITLQKLYAKNLKILVSILWANNETGVIQDMEKISKICQKFNAILHTDAIQILGKQKIDLQQCNIDLMTIAGHKCGGAPCTGILLVKKSLKLHSIIKGGSQENNMRAGLENTQAIWANHVIFDNLSEIISKNQKIQELRDFLEEEILKFAPETIINSYKAPRVTNTSSIVMNNVSSQIQIMFFDINNYAVSNGSACNSGTITNSHVLKAMDLPEKYQECVLRVSLHDRNTTTSVKGFLELWKKLYKKYN